MKSRHIAAFLALPILAMNGVSGVLADKPIYRTTEADGTVVFTDQPAPDAIVVEPGPISVISTDLPASTLPSSSGPTPTDDAAALEGMAPAAGATQTPDGGPDSGAIAGATSGDSSAEDDASGRIDSVLIASPPADATLLDPTGPLLVEVGTEPGSLAESGLNAELLFDGDIVASGGMSQLAAPELLRGSHEIQVRLVNAKGRVVVESAPQALHVRRTTVHSGGGN